ncbi:YkvS family protein [Virgibacillus halodenitrificans]|jgi:uncharacterized protein YkvS|uniref:DUF2187 family protein n=1 Tax=Virgibacillus halodenitrificans TaxID=1482 RepID=A0ABR7VTJ4_VIRHA|nr:DUF2187 family protein [Virgibacillus halodenitrificans]MBD1224661.1 DUF2187 family protein [Virgibacillus halodenitrificans]MCG1027942.1 DUF2187 family protein [Virgibacillus halodenitrificans]MCJ0931830.1 YkvS family protein [Virgibacillus halodenitrificans]MYL45592.1 DUF2187 domain-containing protein [Virgibacillus halodenitrificans]MYL59815.1 DUF2187 domain-containing protein [Virgibacillus halodenitrificans]
MSSNKNVEVGDKISFMSGIQGIVEKINDNSVIVQVTKNNTEHDFEGNKTVVAHKNYEII